MRLTSLPSRVGRRAVRTGRAIAGAAARASRRLADGIPTGFVAALAVLVLVGILYTVATREPKELRGYAEFTMFPEACTIDAGRQLNAQTCVRVARGVYRIAFTKPLDHSTPVASRGSCCPGRIAASVETDLAVLVVVPPRVRAPIRATVLVP
jgi:hypothetical protein